jgi:hypothetical protein
MRAVKVLIVLAVYGLGMGAETRNSTLWKQIE